MSITDDPETLWLSVTNIVLGIVVLIALLAVAFAVVREVRDRKRGKSLSSGEEPGNTLYVSELGLTMADGGQRMKEKKKRKRSRARSGKK